jgi:hypothetical protein
LGKDLVVKKLIALLLVVGTLFISISGCNTSTGTTKATQTTGPGGGSGTTHANKT